MEDFCKGPLHFYLTESLCIFYYALNEFIYTRKENNKEKAQKT